jgi:hypothetical protein
MSELSMIIWTPRVNQSDLVKSYDKSFIWLLLNRDVGEVNIVLWYILRTGKGSEIAWAPKDNFMVLCESSTETPTCSNGFKTVTFINLR